MEISIPLDKMTVEEKMNTIETIWENLCTNSADIPFPLWHEEVLRVRECSIAEGKESFVSWEEAKKQIKKSL
jgi:hypothetical protein